MVDQPRNHCLKICVAIVLSLLLQGYAVASSVPLLAERGTTMAREALKELQAKGMYHLDVLLDNSAGKKIQLLTAHPTVVNENNLQLSVRFGKQVLEFQRYEYKAPTLPEYDSQDGAGKGIRPAVYWFGSKSSNRKAHFSSASGAAFDPTNFIFLARRGDSLRGKMVVDGTLYLLEDVGNGKHAFLEVAVKNELPCLVEKDEAADAKNALAVNEKSPPVDEHSVIKVLLVNTLTAGWIQESPVMNRMIDELEFLNSTNRVYAIPVVYQVVQLMNSGARDDIFHGGREILRDFRFAESAETKIVAQARERLGADVVMVGAVSVFSKGVSYQAARKETAYYVFNAKNPVGFTHQFGHLLGIEHGWNQGDPEFNPTYQHGFMFRYNGKDYPSIGYDKENCRGDNRCKYILYYSDPGNSWEGNPLGTYNRNNEVRRLTERAQIIEAFHPQAGRSQLGNGFSLEP